MTKSAGLNALRICFAKFRQGRWIAAGKIQPDRHRQMHKSNSIIMRARRYRSSKAASRWEVKS